MNKISMNKTTFKIIGLILFLIFLWAVNVATVNNPIYIGIINFLNSNIGIILASSALLILGELFHTFEYPTNLPAPMLNAFGGVLLIYFVFNMIYTATSRLFIFYFFNFESLEFPLAAFVFVLILLLGYIKIFSDAKRKNESSENSSDKKGSKKKSK